MVDIEDIQKRIVALCQQRAKSKNFTITPELSYIHLSEELGEVASQLSSKRMRPDLFDEENLKEEIVDVILEALIIAHTCRVSLTTQIEKKLDVLLKRQSER